MYVHIYIYIYIYRERERERERDTHVHKHIHDKRHPVFERALQMLSNSGAGGLEIWFANITVCITNLYNKIVLLEVCRTFSGRGMGINGTAQLSGNPLFSQVQTQIQQ